ncbi:MAG: hypothetical protein ABI678_11095, partial [Kofleriaceae bacterium]
MDDLADRETGGEELSAMDRRIGPDLAEGLGLPEPQTRRELVEKQGYARLQLDHRRGGRDPAPRNLAHAFHEHVAMPRDKSYEHRSSLCHTSREPQAGYSPPIVYVGLRSVDAEPAMLGVALVCVTVNPMAPSPRLLIVDDDRSSAQLLGQLLRE